MLAAVAASPIHYQIPLYRRLASDPRLDLTVIFASTSGVRPYDAGYGGQLIAWDENLLDGYKSIFLQRADRNDISKGFFALVDWDVVRHIWRGRYDAVWVHGYSYATMWLAILAAMTRRKPFLIREEQTILHKRPWLRAWIRTIVLRLLFWRAHGLYIGTNNRAFFERYGIPRPRLHWAPYAAENERLQAIANALAPKKAALQLELGIEPGSGPVVLFVGRLITKKQPLMLLEAFTRVRRRFPCHLLLVGDGELREELETRVESSRIPDVHITGFFNRSDVLKAFAASDVFTLPSALHETWGMVVNEAMNFGLPIVVTDKVGSAVDLVHNGHNGFVVGHSQITELVDALSCLVSDADLRRELGDRSTSMVRRWTHDRAADGIVAGALAAIRP
jgi:glycosyltransferase involved in cell wall biosynthesis